jgi:hypothetical protein
VKLKLVIVGIGVGIAIATYILDLKLLIANLIVFGGIM